MLTNVFWHYINCLCVCLLNHFLIFFLSYFLFFLYFLPLLFICLLVYFLTYLLFLSRIESLFVGRRFVGGNKTWLQFFGFILFCSRHIFCYQCMFAFIVFVLVFSVLGQEIGWEDRLWNDMFCVSRVGCKTLTQSIQRTLRRWFNAGF